VERVVQVFFDPWDLRASLPFVWDGFQDNLKLMAVSEAIVLVAALVIAIVRGLPGRAAAPLRALAIVYVDVFRGIPLILVFFLVGFGLPALELPIFPADSLFLYGVISISLVYTAYNAEVYRAGIESVHPSQRAAARSLGLSYMQAMRYVIVPQAVRRMVPPLLNDFVGLQKDTALVTAIGLVESLAQAQNYASNYLSFAGYVIAALFFVLLTIPFARFTDYLLKRRELRERALAH
jgi:polar amino acid transport system permease protein